MSEAVSAASPADQQELFTVDQFVRVEPALTSGAVRWMLFHRDENGLSKSGAVVQIGRRVYIRRSKFIDWAASQSTPA